MDRIMKYFLGSSHTDEAKYSLRPFTRGRQVYHLTKGFNFNDVKKVVFVLSAYCHEFQDHGSFLTSIAHTESFVQKEDEKVIVTLNVGETQCSDTILEVLTCHFTTFILKEFNKCYKYFKLVVEINSGFSENQTLDSNYFRYFKCRVNEDMYSKDTLTAEVLISSDPVSSQYGYIYIPKRSNCF